jgi:hypothetical protein
MTPDTQTSWDHETAALTRKLLRRLAAAVRQRRDQEAQRKDDYKAARKASAKLHEQLSTAIEADDPDDGSYVATVGTLAREAEAARDAEDAARREWTQAVARRRRAQDELRVAVRRQFQELPLFDRPQQAEPGPPAPADDPLAMPCIRCRAPAGEKCRDYRGKGKATCAARGQQMASLHEPEAEQPKQQELIPLDQSDPPIETDLDRLLEQASDADAEERPDLSARAPVETARVPADQVEDAPPASLAGWRDLPIEDLELDLSVTNALQHHVGPHLGDLADLLDSGADLPDVIAEDEWVAVRQAIDLARADDPPSEPAPALPHPSTLVGQRCKRCGGFVPDCSGLCPPCRHALLSLPRPATDVQVINGQAGTPSIEGEPIPPGITPLMLTEACICDRFDTPTRKRRKPGQSEGDPIPQKPVTVHPVEHDGRLWVTWGCAGSVQDQGYLVLPLVPLDEWRERFPGIEPHPRPRPGGTHVGNLQLYTGVEVKVGRKNYVIAPAGEGRTWVQQKEGQQT